MKHSFSLSWDHALQTLQNSQLQLCSHLCPLFLPILKNTDKSFSVVPAWWSLKRLTHSSGSLQVRVDHKFLSLEWFFFSLIFCSDRDSPVCFLFLCNDFKNEERDQLFQAVRMTRGPSSWSSVMVTWAINLPHYLENTESLKNKNYLLSHKTKAPSHWTLYTAMLHLKVFRNRIYKSTVI